MARGGKPWSQPGDSRVQPVTGFHVASVHSIGERSAMQTRLEQLSQQRKPVRRDHLTRRATPRV